MTRVVALVDDLIDRSRLSTAWPDVLFARDAPGCAGADVVVVDLTRHGAEVTAVRATVRTARIIGFAPHVDEEAPERALAAGADLALPRSRFFHDPAAAITLVLP